MREEVKKKKKKKVRRGCDCSEFGCEPAEPPAAWMSSVHPVKASRKGRTRHPASCGHAGLHLNASRVEIMTCHNYAWSGIISQTAALLP